jgi:uncharacterized membrane protein YhhN
MTGLQKSKVFHFVFALIALGDIIGRILDSKLLDYMFKPLLLPALAVCLFVGTRSKGISRFISLILAGQILSFAGDVALMFQGEAAFLAGLGSFLCAHIAYTTAFFYERSKKENAPPMLLRSKTWLFTPFLLFLIFFYAYLYPYLGEMRIPVFVYALVIALMSVSALNRFGSVNLLSFRLVFIGSLLFMLSDSILAVSLFVKNFEFSGVAVMLTYIAAQYLIMSGAMKAQDNF